MRRIPVQVEGQIVIPDDFAVDCYCGQTLKKAGEHLLKDIWYVKVSGKYYLFCCENCQVNFALAIKGERCMTQYEQATHPLLN